MTDSGVPAPAYAEGSLADVLPSIAASLGLEGAHRPQWDLPQSHSAVVVLIDGLGFELLRRRGGHAPWLRHQLGAAYRISSGFPSTTPVSMGTFGTGLTPGTHGMVGLEVLDPGAERLFSELSWEDGPNPERWQPRPTWFETAADHGISVMRTGPAFFEGSGLTRASLRGGVFVAAESLDQRVATTIAHASTSGRTLTYLYWGDLDKIGHEHGCESWQWGHELENVDAALSALAEQLPPTCSLTVTADHGMIDVPKANQVDLAYDADLCEGVVHFGGEPRSPQLYCAPGAAPDVLQTWRERLGATAWVLSREEAVQAGIFGAVSPEHLPRIGDVVAAMHADHAVVHSRHHRPEILALVGMHGSLTADEVAVPMLHLAPGSV